jgi:hypothetical protein
MLPLAIMLANELFQVSFEALSEVLEHNGATGQYDILGERNGSTYNFEYQEQARFTLYKSRRT